MDTDTANQYIPWLISISFLSHKFNIPSLSILSYSATNPLSSYIFRADLPILIYPHISNISSLSIASHSATNSLTSYTIKMVCIHGLQSCAICDRVTGSSQGKISEPACVYEFRQRHMHQDRYNDDSADSWAFASAAPFQPAHANFSHHYQYSPPFVGASRYVYSSTGGLQQSPPLPGPYQQHSSYGQQQYNLSLGTPWSGYFPAATPTHQYSPAGSPSTSPPKSMKHMTCYFWHRGSCKYTEEGCLYAHKEFVPVRVAGPPLQKEVGSKSHTNADCDVVCLDAQCSARGSWEECPEREISLHRLDSGSCECECCRPCNPIPLTANDLANSQSADPGPSVETSARTRLHRTRRARR